MGSQTLEILRQGVWASLTGGWFYDPHQDEFCNTFHLYLWLFLLCLPFTIYIYLPPTQIAWYLYCTCVAIALATIKLVNYRLHYMYDNNECITEEVEGSWPTAKKEEEGIEMQVLSSKPEGENVAPAGYGSVSLGIDVALIPSTDGESIDSGDFQAVKEAEGKLNSTIDLKAEVHRKNSSESSEEITVQPATEVVIYHQKTTDNRKRKLCERRSKRQRLLKADLPSTSTANNRSDPRPTRSCLKKDSYDVYVKNLNRPSLQSIDAEQSTSRFTETPRRHSNFTNSTLSFIHSTVPVDIKPTGSLELGYIDKNPNANCEGFFFKENNSAGKGGVRRIRSTALEICCPPPALTVHPNSLEIIGGKTTKNPLPPPSSTLVRNQHLNLCPYYDSEMVYPIAEQSDEHQTSHGPETDVDSLNRNSDSDFEEINQGSRSPLLFQLDRMAWREMTYSDKLRDKDNKSKYKPDDERTSATSKDALLDNENSNSSATPEMQDARTDFYNEQEEKKFCGCTSCSNTSVECEDVLECGRAECSKAKASNACALKRSNNIRKGRKRKSRGLMEASNCSSLLELDLDWLFDDENDRAAHCKDPHKRDTEWSSTTTISLEQDVSKVLQDTPAVRSLGAIPKKLHLTRPQASGSGRIKTPRTVVKSESERCCRRHHHERYHHQQQHNQELTRCTSVKDHKATQQRAGGDGEGRDWVALPLSASQRRMLKLHGIVPRFRQIPRNQNGPEASTSATTAELSTLLPQQPLLHAFLSSCQDVPVSVWFRGECVQRDSPRRQRVKRSGRSGHRHYSSRVREAMKELTIACTLSAGQGTHCARNFNDTSNGSVHCFTDEHGNWVTYTFDDKGLGTANIRGEKGMDEVLRKGDVARTYRSNNNSNKNFYCAENNSGDSLCNNTVVVEMDEPSNANAVANTGLKLRRTGDSARQSLGPLADLTDDDRWFYGEEVGMPKSKYRFIQDPVENNHPKAKNYYKFKIFPWSYVKVTLDRLKLLALLDRNLTLGETLLSIFLGVLVSVFGAAMLYIGFYQDLMAFIFCFVMASCQYSLLKSVQPDAASPTHGFNRLIAYSRPVYFVMVCSIILVLQLNVSNDNNRPVLIVKDTLYTDNDLMQIFITFFTRFLLFFPCFFSLGLFPQINTFVLYLLEQLDMHIFGGNAMTSLLASFYCIFRSSLAVIILTGLAYGGLNEPKSSQHILFSIFCACLVPCSYHLSRSASDPSNVWNILKRHLWPPELYNDAKNKKPDPPQQTSSQEKLNAETKEINPKPEETSVDPLPHKLQKTVNERLKNDLIVCGVVAVMTFVIHASTVFTALQRELSPVLWCVAGVVGFLLHYIIPQLRKQLPWLCIARPVLRTLEHDQHRIRGPPHIMWFEIVYVYFCFLEKNIIYPLLFLSSLTEDSPEIVEKFGTPLGSFLVVICGLKCLRICYSDQSSQYLILTFTALFHKYDNNFIQCTFLIEYAVMSIIYYKTYELILKLQFVVTYIAPWQIPWGSAFHAFAQPFSVPHSAMLFSQALVSAILSTPLNPFLGSAIFLTSYVRPIKFWERDYNTRRVDHSNTPLSSHLERNLGADDNNLNSIFYEHLTRSLQHSLCGDLIMGRWGCVAQGDCFVLASDYLNCLVHIVELGNGLVTFQMRGLEFRGTYCQQREVEAITEGVEEHDGCCCCDPGHLPNMLSVNAAFSQRWLAWEVIAAKYILEGYSISDNSAVSMLQVHDFRKVLITYYVKSIIFYTIRSTKMEEWLKSDTILKALQPMQDRHFVDLDPVFNPNIDVDYDFSVFGMTRSMFCQTYGDWIAFCAEKCEKTVDTSSNSTLVLLCFALSLLGRRTLGAVSHSAVSHNTVPSVEFFLFGLHALFKGDFRITCSRDEWVFTDMDLLKTVVAPGVRMSLKLHQDHFMCPDEYDEVAALYEAICRHEEELVISHEGDPAWRNAVLSGRPSLLALRHVFDDGTDEYKIIMLNKQFLNFRVIKVNKECVRGLWAGQQQELVYLRNRNPERGSIQNAKQALRNIINSSCDQPIGYPIYVSPLTTSYAETNEQLCSIIGGSVSLRKIKNSVLQTFRRVRKRCGEGCSSGASARDEMGLGNEGVYAMTPVATLGHHTNGSQSIEGSQHFGGSIGRGASLSRMSLGANRGSLASMGKPTSSTLASLAGLFKEKDERAVSQLPEGQVKVEDTNEQAEKDVIYHRVKITDPNVVYDCINLGRRIDVVWPSEYMRGRGGRSFWRDWLPETGMEGQVVHKWSPCHKDPSRRSHVDRTILLIQIDDKFVPIAESGVQDLGAEV